jgi:HPt (histidine-containing phosphotransfer) domain-containing protein
LTNNTDFTTVENQRTKGDSINIISSGEDNVINYDIVDSIISISSDNEFTNTLVNSFYDDTKKLLTDMEIALSSNNQRLFLEYAHAIKGSAGSIGAQRIHDYCKILLLPETDSSIYISTLQKLVPALEDTKKKLDNYIVYEATSTN